MPIFEYECKECDYKVELLIVPCEEEPKCPKCLKSLIKGVSLSTFRLKGKGWADDGYS